MTLHPALRSSQHSSLFSDCSLAAMEARAALRRRDAAISWLRHSGASLSQIAQAAGLSKSGVAKILKNAQKEGE